MHRVLLIEDVPEIQLLVRAALEGTHLLMIASTLKEAKEILANSEFEIILLDLSLPDGEGLKFVPTLNLTTTRVIIISGKGEVDDKVMGLTLGASDYLVKPFSPLELKARVAAHLRDMMEAKKEEEFFEKFDLRFYLMNQRVTLITENKEEDIALTPIEFKLLTALARNSNSVLTRNQLLDAAWGDSTHVLDRSVDVHISNLRKKLAQSKASVVAIPGMGYRLIKRN